MDPSPETSPARPRYKWPWFVLAFLLLGLALAVIWMSSDVRRVQDYRNPYSSETNDPGRR